MDPPDDAYEELDRIIQRALHLLDIRRYGLAEREVRRGLALDPDDPYLHLLLGSALEDQEGRLDAAERAYRRALELDPEYALAMCNLSRLFLVRERPTEAARWSAAALEVEPWDTDIRLQHVAALMELKQYSEAEEMVRECLAEDPDSPAVHGALAGVLRDRFRLREAKQAAREALRLEPDNADWHGLLGSVYQQEGNVLMARRCYRRALRLDPSSQEGLALGVMGPVGFWFSLPIVYWSLLSERLPGGNTAVAFLVSGLAVLAWLLHAPWLVTLLLLAYLAMGLIMWSMLEDRVTGSMRAMWYGVLAVLLGLGFTTRAGCAAVMLAGIWWLGGVLMRLVVTIVPDEAPPDKEVAPGVRLARVVRDNPDASGDDS